MKNRDLCRGVGTGERAGCSRMSVFRRAESSSWTGAVRRGLRTAVAVAVLARVAAFSVPARGQAPPPPPSEQAPPLPPSEQAPPPPSEEALPPPSEEAPPPTSRPETPWDRGRMSLTLFLASDSAFGDTYFLVGGGVGYYLYPGVVIGLDGTQWFGGDPSITALSPKVSYVAVPLRFPVKPYVGAFYTHYFIGDPFADLDTIGARVGLALSRGRGVVVGAGAVFERTISECDDDCTSVYPEISIGFTF